jgi:RimJ/RimL family protein N-acetyltransferase
MLTLEPWSQPRFGVLEACNSAEMTAFLGGPESDEKLADRHRRYLNFVSTNRDAWPFCAMLDGEAIGSIGYWENDDCYEIGWAVIPAFQGRGLAAAAVSLALDDAAARGGFGTMTACPGVGNLPSNELARRLGFVLAGEETIEYPAGQFMRANRWNYDLTQRERRAN